MRRTVGVLVAACVGVSGAVLAAAPVAAGPATPVNECDIEAAASFDGGAVSFTGTASEVGGVESVQWTHTDSVFGQIVIDATDALSCDTNGGTLARIEGFGAATVNGVPGFTYFLDLEDLRDAPSRDSVPLTASVSYDPYTQTPDSISFPAPRQVRIPQTIEVIEGNPGTGAAVLLLDRVRCVYRGDFNSYEFASCRFRPSWQPGDRVSVTEAELRVRTSGLGCESVPVNPNDPPTFPPPGCTPIPTTATVDIGTGDLIEAPGSEDLYTILIADPNGTLVYDYGSAVVDGDIRITLL